MARYKVLEKSFIDNKLYEAGEEVEYAGAPAANLEALDVDAKKAVVEVEKSGVNTEIGNDMKTVI